LVAVSEDGGARELAPLFLFLVEWDGVGVRPERVGICGLPDSKIVGDVNSIV
jgi:hypothetical protein